jgi:hypothetical protein
MISVVVCLVQTLSVLTMAMLFVSFSLALNPTDRDGEDFSSRVMIYLLCTIHYVLQILR